MKGKLGFVAGVAVGYVLGTRAGRKSYESLKSRVSSLWHTDPVQEAVANVENELKDVAGGMVEKAKATVGSHLPASFSNRPEPVSGSEAGDVVTDPALNDNLGQDWTDEGGATPSGPATSSN
ncbi:hypothetical protein AS189_13125 [Arthrobacter alpinus]|uniref:YtxH domain-containing protein n=1 Tax=Arthrobacter alpinus TaxID=656366 RepID=A0A0S2M1J0_9MICC|nr:YtxH domain-containing protein [Arthrobacter alpinus]ALO67271.1 hypothetical protein AS189_13125 [Arthrobacter alpinus]